MPLVLVHNLCIQMDKTGCHWYLCTTYVDKWTRQDAIGTCAQLMYTNGQDRMPLVLVHNLCIQMDKTGCHWYLCTTYVDKWTRQDAIGTCAQLM